MCKLAILVCVVATLEARLEVHNVSPHAHKKHVVNDKTLERAQKQRIQQKIDKRKERKAEQKMKRGGNREPGSAFASRHRDKDWSQYEGVTLQALETARNHSTRFQPTSCKALIRDSFDVMDSLPEPVSISPQMQYDTRTAAETGLTFLHIPKVVFPRSTL
jgi:hypothetical protein